MPDTNKSFEQLYTKIENAVKDLTTLKVVTAVGDVTITEKAETADGKPVIDETGKPKQSRVEQYLNAKAIISTIDLVDGDIETIMDGVFASDNAAYTKIRDEHMERIKEAHNIVDKNVETLQKLIKTISEILAARSTIPPAPPPPPPVH